MSKKRLLIFLVTVLAGFPVTLWAQGANVEVQLKDGRALTGELYAVRDSAILVLLEEGNAPDDFKTTIPGYCRIETRLIRRVIVQSESVVFESMGLGLLVGGGIGAVIGLASGDDPPGFLSMSAGEKAGAGGLVLGAGGALVGLVVGIAKSGNDREIEPLPDGDLSALKKVARYPTGEPTPIKRIQ